MGGGALPAAVVVFAAAVLASRVGLWSFDMVNAQLFQQTVSPREVASASSAEMALCSLSELIMLGLAAYVITPESYSLLVYGSFAAVLASNALYSWWLANNAGETCLPWAAAAA
jgi:iron-regulated transporter 1